MSPSSRKILLLLEVVFSPHVIYRMLLDLQTCLFLVCFKLLIWKAEYENKRDRQKDGEQEREREQEIFHLLLHCHSACHSRGGRVAQAKARSSIQVFCTGNRNADAPATTCCLSGTIAGSWIRSLKKQRSTLLALHTLASSRSSVSYYLVTSLFCSHLLNLPVVLFEKRSLDSRKRVGYTLAAHRPVLFGSESFGLLKRNKTESLANLALYCIIESWNVWILPWQWWFNSPFFYIGLSIFMVPVWPLWSLSLWSIINNTQVIRWRITGSRHLKEAAVPLEGTF